MDYDVFEVKDSKGRLFATDEEIRDNLRQAAQKPYEVKEKITFAGDKFREKIQGLQPMDDSSDAERYSGEFHRPAYRRAGTRLRGTEPGVAEGAYRAPPGAAPRTEGTLHDPAATTPEPPGQTPDGDAGAIFFRCHDEFRGHGFTDSGRGTGVEDTEWSNCANAGAAPRTEETPHGPAAPEPPDQTLGGDAGAPPEKPVTRMESYQEFLHRTTAHNRPDRIRAVRQTAERLLPTYGDPYYGDAARIMAIRTEAAKVELSAAAVIGAGRIGIHTVQAARRGIADVRGGTMTAQQAFKMSRNMMLKEAGGTAIGLVKRGGGLVVDQAVAFDPQTTDVASSAPIKFKNAAVESYRIGRAAKKIMTVPHKKVLLIGGAVALLLGLLLSIATVATMTTTTTLAVLCANRIEDIQQLVTALNNYRDKALTTELYNAFRGDTDPNGNPYGYNTLTGKKSNNLTHGITWAYANGISNDTAEIISMAAVYFQQNWPASELFTDIAGSEEPFFAYCKDLTAYGLDATAQESAPYSCLTYGGCVQGYRSEGELVQIKDYRQVTHVCQEGDSECGHYVGAGDTERWEWSGGHGEGQSHEEWVGDGTHEARVYFPVTFPEGANSSELSTLPDGAVPVSGTVAANSTGGSLVLSDYNLYKGNFNDWFYKPGELTGSFSVVTGEGEDAITDTYEVTFQNAAMVPWCPGELKDGKYGHYDLDVTLYLDGYDHYENPETEDPDGNLGGSGNLKALAKAADAGNLTRTVLKKNQHGETYTGSATAAQLTKTVKLPQSVGFTAWYAGDSDRDGNVAWAELLYKMDWEELYKITDGIKCKTIGRGLSAAELEEILAALGLAGDDARAQVAAVAIASQGKFGYTLGAKPSGGPGNVSVGAALDCSGFMRYCYWSVGLPFAALNTGDYAGAGDLVEISADVLQPGDLRVVYSSGGVSGHVQMYIGSGSWAECCSGYGVSINMSNSWMESRPCHYFSYAGF